MTKTIAEFFGLSPRTPNQKPKDNKDFYLDDLLEDDPRDACPNCASNSLKALACHVDGLDYRCNACGRDYTIFYNNRGGVSKSMLLLTKMLGI